VTSHPGYFADVTLKMVTLAVGHGQMTFGLLGDVTKQVCHIRVMTDITVRTATLAAQHKYAAQVP